MASPFLSSMKMSRTMIAALVFSARARSTSSAQRKIGTGSPAAGAATNPGPAGSEYLFPGNDDSLKSIQLFVRTIAEACIAGKMRSKDKQEPDEKFGSIEAGRFHDDQGHTVAVEKVKKFDESVN